MPSVDPVRITLPAAAAGAARRPVIAAVVQQHAEEAAFLRSLRTRLVRAPHVGLLQLGRLDERIAAHLDGLAVAGEDGTARLVAALDGGGTGEVFALAVRALEMRDAARLDRLLALVPVLDDGDGDGGWRGLVSALGWVPAPTLQGVVPRLLASSQPEARAAALAACRMHRVDPGAALARAVVDDHARVRVEALRCAAAVGRADLRQAARAAVADGDPAIVFWAAWAAVLMGERGAAWQVLAHAAQPASPTNAAQPASLPLPLPLSPAQASQAAQALALAMAAGSPADAADLARRLSAAAQARPAAQGLAGWLRLMDALALLGDPRFVPWLIERMADPLLARRAGQAWCWITGADLAANGLEALAVPGAQRPASDADEDDAIAIDDDEDLPWPDPARVAAWWKRHGPALAGGGRLFAGEPVGVGGARRVLVEGTQRLRAHAALLLGVLQPGSRLFPVAAPARRQRRWLNEEMPPC